MGGRERRGYESQIHSESDNICDSNDYGQETDTRRCARACQWKFPSGWPETKRRRTNLRSDHAAKRGKLEAALVADKCDHAKSTRGARRCPLKVNHSKPEQEADNLVTGPLQRRDEPRKLRIVGV